VRSNLEPVEVSVQKHYFNIFLICLCLQGYQSTNQGLYNIDLKNVVDITKPPPNITPITTGIFVFLIKLVLIFILLL